MATDTCALDASRVKGWHPSAQPRRRYELATLDHVSRVESVAQAVPDKIDRHDREEYREPREDRGPRRFGHILRGVLEHVPPRGHRWLDAESEERQGALRDDGPGDAEGGRHDDRRERVREDVSHDQVAVSGPDRVGRQDELALLQREERPADDP